MAEALFQNPAGQKNPLATDAAGTLRFHVWIAAAALVLLLVDVIGCRLTQVHVPFVGGDVIAAILLVGTLQLLPLYWHRKRRIKLRESSLTLIWAAMLWIALPFPVDVAARLGRAFPLRDALLARLDAQLGVNIAAVVHWTAQHSLLRAANVCYALLTPMLVLAFLLPGLLGKEGAVKRLLVGNLAAFAIGLPLFAWMPAVGPWYGQHFAPDRTQSVCQTEALLVREPGPYEHRPAGVICFPSFHVMWAILCAEALSSFRRLRWPAWVLAALIISSTMMTGWHYFVDVLGGVALAGVSLAAGRWLVRDGSVQQGRSD